MNVVKLFTAGACCAHLPVTSSRRKKLLSAAHLVLNSRVIRATMLIEINSSAQELEYAMFVPTNGDHK